MVSTFQPPVGKVRAFRRTPPAVFPAILGLMGLGLAWQKGADAFGVPTAIVELFLGAVSMIFLFAVGSYWAKFLKRPSVWAEDARTVPGRGGLAAKTISMMLFAAVLVPYSHTLATIALVMGFAGHLAGAGFTLFELWRAPERLGPMTPMLHLVFVGFIVAPASAVPLGYYMLMPSLTIYALIVSTIIWARTLPPLFHGKNPAPLRPLQAIHLAPAALIGSVALLIGQDLIANAMIGWSSLIFFVLLLRGPWLTEAGFSGFWSAFTFPTAAFAGLWCAVANTRDWPGADTIGAVLLIATTLIVPPIAFKVLRLWADGTLAAKTNAAIA